MLWGSNTFHINGKVQPKIFLTLLTTYCDSWGQGWKTSSDSVCFTLKEFDEKGSLREWNVCSAWPWKQGRGPGWSRASYFHLPLCPCSSSRGAGNAHQESEDRVESWPCHLLPMWLWVSYLISLGLSFSLGLWWGFSNMISGNVLCKLPRSMEHAFLSS